MLQDRAALFGKVQQSQRAHTITENRIGRRHKKLQNVLIRAQASVSSLKPLDFLLSQPEQNHFEYGTKLKQLHQSSPMYN